MTKHRSREARREQILDAAVRCFSKKGYHETTMDDVVRDASLSKGTLYWHFKSKGDLFRALAELWFAEIIEVLDRARSSEGPAADKLRSLVSAIDQSAMARPELVGPLLEFYLMAVRDPELRLWFRGVYEESAGLIRALIEEGIDQGEFRAADSGAVARLIMAYMDGALLHREFFEPAGSSSPAWDELADTLVALLEVDRNGG